MCTCNRQLSGPGKALFCQLTRTIMEIGGIARVQEGLDAGSTVWLGSQAICGLGKVIKLDCTMRRTLRDEQRRQRSSFRVFRTSFIRRVVRSVLPLPNPLVSLSLSYCLSVSFSSSYLLFSWLVDLIRPSKFGRIRLKWPAERNGATWHGISPKQRW